MVAKVIKMSRKLEKTPIYFQNFILRNDLWPYLSTKKNPLLKNFSVSSIENDIRGKNIKEWHLIVNHFLQDHKCKLIYNRATSKQLLIFDNESDATMFALKWS